MYKRSVLIALLLTNALWGSVIEIETMDDVRPVYSSVDFFWSSCGKELNELAHDLKIKKPVEHALLRKIYEEIQRKSTRIAEEAMETPSAFYFHINKSIKFLEEHKKAVEENGINYVLFLNELKIIKYLHLKMKMN